MRSSKTINKYYKIAETFSLSALSKEGGVWGGGGPSTASRLKGPVIDCLLPLKSIEIETPIISSVNGASTKNSEYQNRTCTR